MKKITIYIIISSLFLSINLFSQEESPPTEQPKQVETEKQQAQETQKPSPQTTTETPKPQTGGQVGFSENRLLDMIEKNPKNPEPYFTLIRYYTAKEMRKERLKIAIKYIQNIGGNAYMYQIIGDENRLAGEYSKALVSYQYALRLSPNNAALYNRIGLVLLKLENFNQAEAAFKAAIYFGANENNMNKAAYYNNLGVSYEAMNDIENAIKNFKIAVKFYPTYQTALDNLKRLENR
ncbi:MAG: tetratricopeptide repeat protein [Brevinematales bacterium]|nr:tetratricopeptide repeat protein [Brevinematales bacterium]